MKILNAVVLCLLSAAPASAQAPLEQVKTELRALRTELSEAITKKDRAALERIYADEFVFVHALGVVVDKKAQIEAALAANNPPQLPLEVLDGLLVFGDVAILRRPSEANFGTTIYVKRNGRWQIVQLQGTALPTTRRNASVPADVLQSYVGRYEQDNGLFTNVAVEGGTLSLDVEGRQKFTLIADAADTFSLPAGAGQFTFTKAADGTMTYRLVRGNGQIVNGKKVK